MRIEHLGHDVQVGDLSGTLPNKNTEYSILVIQIGRQRPVSAFICYRTKLYVPQGH